MISIFLDSGAYSVVEQGVSIDLDKYITLIKKYEKYIDGYANLDTSDGEESYQNWLYIRSFGLNPIPVYHINGYDIKYLYKYMEMTDYIAIGTIADVALPTRMRTLDYLWAQHLVDKEGYPKVKVHGFGLTSIELITRYPWFSLDSTSWVLASSYGFIFVPKFDVYSNTYIYRKRPYFVTLSTRSKAQHHTGKHFNTFSPLEQNHILKYIEGKGFKIGKSEHIKVDKNYKLQEGESWFEKGLWVEKIIESGLCNNNKIREDINISFFLDVEEAIPEWPWPFKMGKMESRRLGLNPFTIVK